VDFLPDGALDEGCVFRSSNRRLIAADDRSVTFTYEDYRIEGPGHYMTMTLETAEFIRRGQAAPITKLAFEFLILTAVRASEARKARWDEIDGKAKTWTIPGHNVATGRRMKMERDHIVPLSARCRTFRAVGALTFQMGVRIFRMSGVATLLTGISPMAGAIHRR
jgi:hypothetical protein